MHGVQLSLPVQLPQPCRFDTFVSSGDAAALAQLQAGRSACLIGGAQMGKTHLLLSACHAHQGRYLPLGSISGEQIDVLSGIVPEQPLAIDECEAMPLHPDFWMALLRLLDQRQRQGAVTWVASRHPPDVLAIPRDLQTRIMQLPTFTLLPLDERAQQRLLQQGALRRGLYLPDEVVRWWLRHLPRDAASLLAGLEHIDRAALQARRRLTLPFVQAVLDPPVQTEGGWSERA